MNPVCFSSKLEAQIQPTLFHAVRKMETAGINRIDILIANAGVSPPIQPLETVDPKTMGSTFQVNTLGPLALYQAFYAMLKKSKNPKFVTVSSAAGSIGGMEKGGTWVAPACCVSKAGLNWITLYGYNLDLRLYELQG
jgi:norsolorinic acid ketoreductase